ncbi:TRAF-type zinc finger domain-containing protein 1-like isoform X1 [Periplaneta americana]|uniref:TRAF-type zinc finger domain-containing protein 1-like isoform X1 n=1 Tax=Periplaneta americana TaxID=6978 RepID=UPI0037E8EF81
MCDDDVKFCSNCKREVPQSNFVMHNVHCQRKLALCVKCDEPVPRCELAAHNTNVHAIVECPACGHQCEKRHLVDHQNSTCSRRAICCNYCHIETQANELAEHENYCGSRTERCEDCGEFVMLKYQQLHQDSNHGFLKLEDEPGPAPSWSNTRSTTSNLLNDLSRQRKVSNASQDSARPTSASNRLSPSKRTNDMPQVNSASTAVPKKDLHKSTIPSDDGGVDLDRLLALRLAEQERMLNTIPTAPYEVDLGVPPQKGGELVALPCEFCQAMVPANQLVIHETGCRPDLARYDPAPLPPPPPRNRKPSSSSEEEEDIDGLPCEFCGSLFPPQFLLQHQALCDVTPPLSDGILVNELGPLPRSSNRTTKKLLNMSPDTPWLFPPTSVDHMEDKNAYLNEMRAALKKPMASVRPIGRHYSSGSEFAQQNEFGTANCRTNLTSPGCANGLVRHSTSTGAVPKQKAGRRVNSHEVSQEVPRSTATPVTPSGHLRFRNTDANR